MDNSEKKLTSEEKRIKRIAQIRATLQKEEALLSQNRRKKRNGQLITAGVMVERLYLTATPDQRESLKKKAIELLSDERSWERMREMFARLDTNLAEVKDTIEGRADEQPGEE